MDSCQNCGPFLGTLNIRCRIIIRTQKGTIILTTTHVHIASFQSKLASGEVRAKARQGGLTKTGCQDLP